MLWMLKYLLLGYRVVDSGCEIDGSTAVRLAMDTTARYSQGRSVAVKIYDKTWVVMVQGWSPRKENG